MKGIAVDRIEELGDAALSFGPTELTKEMEPMDLVLENWKKVARKIDDESFGKLFLLTKSITC